MATKGEGLKAMRERILQMGPERHKKRVKEDYGKLLCRERLEILLDPGSIVEDGLMANCLEEELAADGVVTVLGKVNGRDVAVMANDFSVKAGSWGPRTVEKIIRIQETAMRLRIPMIYLVDSAGLRITDQIYCFPGRRHAGRIFHLQALMSGMIPQVCILSGPSAAGGAYIPTFCDVIICVDKLGAMYLGSPRMAEVTIGEKVTLEEMGGSRMHCSVSGVGDVFAESEEEALQMLKDYLSYFPQLLASPQGELPVGHVEHGPLDVLGSETGHLHDVPTSRNHMLKVGGLPSEPTAVLGIHLVLPTPEVRGICGEGVSVENLGDDLVLIGPKNESRATGGSRVFESVGRSALGGVSTNGHSIPHVAGLDMGVTDEHGLGTGLTGKLVVSDMDLRGHAQGLGHYGAGRLDGIGVGL